MLKKLFIGLAVLLAVFAIVASRQPSDFKISRSTTVNARPAKVFAQVNDFHKWQNWSPWDKMDPSMKKSFEGPAAGEGAVYSWTGNSKVGEGKMTILKSQAPSLVAIQLDFMKPMKATNLTEFSFAPEGKGTQVSWTMSGHNNFVSKAFSVFMDMDKMIGSEFEKGLAQMKAQAEAK
jgi:uncharacterized protein YndB with AHSA1/START domain